MEGREEVSTMFGEGLLLMAQEASRGREAANTFQVNSAL